MPMGSSPAMTVGAVRAVRQSFGRLVSDGCAAAAHQLFLAAAAHGEGAKDDAFVIRVWQALTGITLPKGG